MTVDGQEIREEIPSSTLVAESKLPLAENPRTGPANGRSPHAM